MTPENKRVGVLIIGSHGAVATTMMAGAALMRRGLVPRHGMLTESAACAGVPLVDVDDLVFGGWALRTDNEYEAAVERGVVPPALLDHVEPEPAAIRPCPPVATSRCLVSMSGKNFVLVNSVREELDTIIAN